VSAACTVCAIEILVERARVKNAAEFWRFLTEAALGESVDLLLQPTGPMRALIIRAQFQPKASALQSCKHGVVFFRHRMTA
jgi:hypothetical protein